MKRVFSFLLVLLLVVGLMPVQVAADATVWNIRVAGDSQYVTISPNPARENDTVTVTPKNGYKITSLEVRPSDGEPLTITENGSARSFTMPGDSVDMLVQVESEDGNGAPHSINLLSAGSGTPSVDKNPAAPGETVNVTPNPDTGNVLERIQIDYYPATGGNTIYDIPNNGTSFVMPDDIEPGGEVKVTVYYKRDPNAGPVTTPLKVWCYFHPTSGAGTVTAPETAVPGRTVTFTVLPNEGYKADVTVYNAANPSISIDYTRISQTEYQFTMPEDIPYIFVQFTEGEDDYVPGGGGGNEGGSGEGGGGGTPEEGVYNISVKENAFATIEVQKTAEAYDYVDVSITPVAGYRVSNFTVWTLPDYGPVDEYSTFSGEYYFLMPESDVLVAAYVWPLDGTVEYTITNTTDSPNGTATTPAKSAAGVTIPITTTPAEGYEVDTITVVDTEGTPVTVTGNKFVMPDDNVTVNVTFKPVDNGSNNNDPVRYSITTEAENGTVKAYVDRTVVTEAAKGDEVTVTAMAAEGYELDTLTVTGPDQVPADIKDTKTFTMPEGAVTVTATFEKEAPQYSGLTFEYGYDVQRSPTYPKKGGTFRVSGFAQPLNASSGRTDNEGPWTLTGVGTYGAIKDQDNLPSRLSGIVSNLAREYGVEPDSMPIHVLTHDGNYITHGVLVMHNTVEDVAFFIGSNWNNGSGYLFCRIQQSGSKTYDVPTDVTDQVDPPSTTTKITVTFDPNGGSVTPDKIETSADGKLPSAPEAARDGYTFLGWFTAQTGGDRVTKDTVFTANTTVYAHWEKKTSITVEHITEPENNSYSADLDMTDEDVLKKILGDEAATEDTQVWMTVVKLADAPSTEKQAIEAKAASDKLATYLDIKLFKKVGNRNAETISNTHGPVTITMTLDAGVVPANAESVYIVYYHGGAKTIPASYNHSTRVLTFQASEFSTYALAYKLQSTAAAAPASTGYVLDNVPKTGDSNPLMGWTMLVLCSAAMLAAVAVFDKKRAR